jgi:hypothetical protein
VDEPIEVEHEEQQGDGDAEAGQGHAQVRDGVGLDPSDDVEGEDQGADKLGQQELEPAIAVPHAHVAR